MGERQWRPGDVAHVDVADGPAVAIWTGEFWAWSFGNGPFDGVSHCHRDVPARPVVVIDPEDREGVERLIADYARKVPDGYWPPDEGDDHDMSTFVESMQAALREFANPTPPKPDEPLGLGAVVEDSDGLLWVRCCADDGPGDDDWRANGSSVWTRYKDIAAVRILSAGVTDGGDGQ